MAISIISVSSDSIGWSVGTSIGRVIVFGTIHTIIQDTSLSMILPSTYIDTTPIHIVSSTIPPSPDYTHASPDYSPASDTKSNPFEDPSSDHIPPLPVNLSILSSIDDSSDNDIPDTPPSATHGTPFTGTTLYTHRSPAASGSFQRRVMFFAPGQPIPHGRPYRYYLIGPVHIMTARNQVGPLPTHLLAVRNLVGYSSSDHFASNDSSSSSSSETSLDSSADALSDSASIHSSFDHSLPTPSLGMRPSHHLCLLVPSIPRSSAAIFAGPSHDSSFGSLSRKRSRSPAASVPLSLPVLGALSYAHVDLSSSPKRIRCSEFAMDLDGCSEDRFKPSRPRETELEMDVDVVRSDGIDIDLEIQVVIDECFAYAHALRDRGIDARVLVEAVDRDEIEMGARGPVEVRVDRVTHPVIADDISPRAQEEGAVKVTCETLGDLIQRTASNTRSGARMTREAVNEQIYHRLAGALGAHDAARNLEPLMGNGGSGNEGNRNGNGNGGENGYNYGGFMSARECTYQDFLKCQPLSFNRTEGVVGLTHWFEKMETVFHISNCPEKYQVKYVTCTLLNSALTWWNSHKRTIGIKAAYAMSWAELIKLMKKVYCPINELCSRMVLNEKDKVERFMGGLLDYIQGNVIAAEPTKLQYAIRIANNLIDQKLKGYARSAKNKRRLENNPSDNHGQQSIFKRQNVGGKNVARAYTAGNNEKKEYVGSLPNATSARCIMHDHVL
nr:hypothetical protein [Tanacetum cinerariifolium]